MINALTIDVEDYFHVTAFEGSVKRSDWDLYPFRAGDNTRRILDILDEHNVKATFFVLGWVAEKDPALVGLISARGHEVACHGYGHERVYMIGPDAFREDVRRAKALLEDQCGKAVNGYRAPTYSITGDSLWALDILIEQGFTYDSSIFPIVHDNYGIPDAERFPHAITRPVGRIVEFPLTTMPMNFLGRSMRLPIAGGGYLRLLPVGLIRNGFKRLNKLERQPGILYFHPWELDPDQPRIKAGFKSRFRHYVNLHTTEGKIRNLLRELDFAPVSHVLGLSGQTGPLQARNIASGSSAA